MRVFHCTFLEHFFLNLKTFLPFSSFSEDINHTKDGSLIHSYGIHHSLLVFTDWGKDIQGWQSDSQLWLTSWSVFIDWGKDIHHTKDGSLSD